MLPWLGLDLARLTDAGRRGRNRRERGRHQVLNRIWHAAVAAAVIAGGVGAATAQTQGHDQDRRAAFAVGHDGDQRDDPQGHRPDDGRRHQQEGRAARQEGRGGGRRSGVELAALRRKGARAVVQGQGRRRVRLLDLGIAQIGAAGLRGAERAAVLSGAVRGRGELQQRLLYRRRAQPAGDPGGRVSDEQGRRRRRSAGCSKAPTTSIRAPPTRSSRRS